MPRLDNKIAIITGAAQGTGEAIARHFVAEGAQVVIADLQAEAGQALAQELGPNACYSQLDVSDEDQWQATVKQTIEVFGEPTVLVNNAAILYMAKAEETSKATMEQIVAINQIGPVLGMQAVLPSMKRVGSGSIVNIGSIDGVLPGAHGILAYSASKWALRGITKVAALEWGEYGIRVNIVNPDSGNPMMSRPFVPEGVSDEQLLKGAKSLWTKTLKLQQQPQQKQRQRVDDIAQMVMFLAADESSACTGGDYPVDGGYTAGIS